MLKFIQQITTHRKKCWGLLDEVIVQIYREELTSLKSKLKNNDLLRIKNKIPVAIGLYTGPFLKAKSIEKVKQEVKIVQQSTYKGVSFFCWETTLWFFKGGSHDSVEQSFRKLFI
ncbi:MAG: hypothetical protein KME29_12365 [Calothrix sp. FI2-JRJ7]|jgi:uncharacterized lipoprotein YddW (UPF0748 family)|nr:hypothetical protein [Calothrix sp. FI2-JRJ7]